MQKDSWDTIGTHISIQIDTDQDCTVLFDTIRERLRIFEQKYSRFIPGNWLDTLNISRSAPLDEESSLMLEFALDTAEKTGGYFDPTVAGRLATLGYGRSEHIGSGMGWRYVEKSGNEILLKNNVILEFGGVGKGYLLDVIKRMIDDSFENIPRYMIDFGGDIYGYGGWEVGLENPHNLGEVVGTTILDDGFLACSSGSKRRWDTHHHLIDPTTGESATEIIATYIVARSGIIADSYATALAVMPFLVACEYLYSSDTLEGVILASDGRCFQSERSRIRLFTH